MCGWGGYGQYPGEPSGGSEDEKDALAETRGRRWQLRRLKCWVRRRRRKCTKRTSAASSIISHLCCNSFAYVHSALDLVSKSFASNATPDTNTYWQLAAASAHANASSTSDYTPKPTFASVDMDIGSMSGTGSEIGGGSLFIWFYSNNDKFLAHGNGSHQRITSTPSLRDASTECHDIAFMCGIQDLLLA